MAAMVELDRASDWGGTWEVVMPDGKRARVEAWSVSVTGGALVFTGDGTDAGWASFQRAFGPGTWLEVNRAGELPDGAQVYGRSR